MLCGNILILDKFDNRLYNEFLWTTHSYIIGIGVLLKKLTLILYNQFLQKSK